MRNLFIAACLTVFAALAGVWTSPSVSAEHVLDRVLDTSMDGLAVRIGNTTWLEDCGVGVNLAPAPPPGEAFPRLLAGEKRPDTGASASFWELGPDGLAALQKRLERQGASFQTTAGFEFRPRLHGTAITAHRTQISLPGGRVGTVVDWSSAGRAYALVVSAARAEALIARLDPLLREVIHMPGVGEGAIAPLCFDGRYAFVLNGWQRAGDRLYRDAEPGWFSLRVFRIPLTEFESVGRLQLELENKLDAAGFKRSGGMRPTIAGREGFVGEYYGNDGFVQRIAYARLNGGYMVALMQAPESARGQLESEMNGMIDTLQPTGLGAGVGPATLYFSAVRNIRCLAWQDGNRVLWGVLFDDGRNQPVIWRQEGIAWSVEIKGRGETMAVRAGEVNTSRALNPLVDSDGRALPLPQNFSGEVELRVNVGGERTTTRLTIK